MIGANGTLTDAAMVAVVVVWIAMLGVVVIWH